MSATDTSQIEFADAWIDGDDSARWRSGTGHGPGDGAVASGSSLLEVEPGCHLPTHTDSAEETIVLTAGRATVRIGEVEHELNAGGIALVPADLAHEVRNAGSETLRFVAVYAGTDVTTTYEQEVQPDGARERKPLG